MKEELIALIREIQSDKRLGFFDEAKIRQAVIVRILSCLGWNLNNVDEVTPEYTVGVRRVDYSLRQGNYNKVFIEVKNPNEDLEGHQEQLLDYSFKEGIKLAVLTNGISWWFYLPLHEGSWEQRKFYTIEIYDQKAEDIAQKFIDFLSKENILNGIAVENATKIITGKQKEILIKNTIPKAWDKLLSEHDEKLLGLIAETTEKLCGYKPDYESVEIFLASWKMSPIVIEKPSTRIKMSPSIVSAKKGDYSNNQITAFQFNRTRYEVKSWTDMLLKVSNIIHNLHKDRFENVLSLVGRKRPYFSRNLNDLRRPEKISGTNIYIEVNLSANSKVKLVKDLIALFGYPENSLSFEIVPQSHFS